MRIKDAIASLQLKRKEKPDTRILCTPWSEQADDSPDVVPLAEYPRPQMVRSNWLCLNGWWDYRILQAKGASLDVQAIKEEDSEEVLSAGKILVPFSPETRRSGVNRTLHPGEILRYQRIIPEPDLKEGQRLILHFGAVDERCLICWNDQKVKKHQNGYLPFSMDVTPYIKPGDNTLTVYVRDDTDFSPACRGKQTLTPQGMYYHSQSGIWQTVWMEIVPELHLRKMKITPLPEESKVKLQLRIDGLPAIGSIRNTNLSTQKPLSGESGSGKPFDPADDPAPLVCVSLEGKKYTFEARPKMTILLPVMDVRLWSPENPVLYPMQIQVGQDVVDTYFAMRSFGTGTDLKGHPCLTLNGSPYFFHGVLDQGYWPETLMTPPADEAMIHDIMEMKNLSFTMIRKHVKIEPARWYYHCDRLGMVVWQDMVNGGGPVNKLLETYLPNIVPSIRSLVSDSLYRLFSREDPKAREQFEKDTLRMVRHLYNCPCIGMWIPFNEGWGQFDSLRVSDLVKTEDPSRPVDHASGWFDQGGGDVLSLHNYFRKLKVVKDRHGRSCVLSEYGGYNCNIDDHTMSEEVYGYHTYSHEDFIPAFRELMEKIWKLQEKGLSGAVYTQLSDIEEETNGLLTYDRKVSKIKP